MIGLRERGTTILFSTHDMDMAEKMCDTIFMIFNGRKVLDGTLSSIQAQYPADRVRVEFEDGSAMPEIDGISDIESKSRFHEFRLLDVGNSQAVLHQLISQKPVTHFEILKPSLHDIFVRIARPQSPQATV